MATNIKVIEKNIQSLYDFNDKSVIQIGAGGGQLIGCAKNAKSVIAVDNDPTAVEKLRIVLKENEQPIRISIIEGTIDSISQNADIVFFEFCLHEIDDPEKAIQQSLNLAPEVLVVDHHPDSSWAWYTCETQKATQSWSAVEKYSIIQKESFKSIQYFSDYSDLYSRLASLGDLAIKRIQKFESQNNIEIEMKYSIALIKRKFNNQ